VHKTDASDDGIRQVEQRCGDHDEANESRHTRAEEQVESLPPVGQGRRVGRDPGAGDPDRPDHFHCIFHSRPDWGNVPVGLIALEQAQAEAQGACRAGPRKTNRG
jgi:hypothetical protein